MANEAASSSSSVSNSFTYQAFLSFRGKDTRFHFTGDLYNALDKEGINTFMDPKLPKGEEISAELVKAIKESEVSIIVFSENYADSRWCLDELVEILQCKASNQQQVRPIFYKVDPSHVRHQTGKFGDAFNKLDQASRYKDSIPKWRKALADAANLSGWHFSDGESEFQCISKIVKELSANVLIPSNNLEVAKYPIGIDSRRQHVEKLLDMENESVRMVGIWGAGGIGKSTIAKSVFNSIRHNFEASFFLEDVRSNSIPLGGLDKLQKTLLSHMRVKSMRTMQRKKVLIVLDDVSDLKQLEKLAPSIDDFGPRSRIIITTRDERVLTVHEVGLKYDVKLLDDVQALQLFSRHAFKKDGPLEGYHELTQRAVHYAGGLPLALTILGSHLVRRSKGEWEALLDSCKGDHQTDIKEVLKISYDALGDELKEFFLDIACFFKGEPVDYVKPILEACHGDLKPVIGLAQLQEKSLIRIDRVFGRKDLIWMHDLIEEMGKDIGKNSRLWNWDDFDRALTDNTETERLKGIQIHYPPVGWHSKALNAKNFSKMKNLKYFSVAYSKTQNPHVSIHYLSNKLRSVDWFDCPSVSFPSNYSATTWRTQLSNIDYLCNELRWFSWNGCPLLSFPTNFSPRKLVQLNISSSCIIRLWEGRKILPFLKYLELDFCKSLVELPDFIGTPNLESLTLRRCSSLVEMPHSMGALHKLVTLCVHDCMKLTALPKFNGNRKMDFMRELSISACGIQEVDGSIENLTGLQDLYIDGCACLTTLSSSIYGLQNLRFLVLNGCSRLTAFPTNSKNLPDDNGGGTLSLPILERLNVRGCNLSECNFLNTLDCLDTLTFLDLSGNKFLCHLPKCISKFLKLERLDLRGCERLREVPELPPNLVWVDASDCDSLERIWNLSEVLERQKITAIRLWNCCNLGFNIVSLEGLLLNIQANSQFVVVFPGTITVEDAKWLDCWKPVTLTDDQAESSNSEGSITISKNLKWENLGLAVIAESVEDMSTFYCDPNIFINGVSISVDYYNLLSRSGGSSHHVWVLYIPLTVEMKAKVEDQKGYSSLPHYECVVQFRTGVSFYKTMKSFGAHLVCKESKDDENSSHKVVEDPIQQKRLLRESNASDFPELSNPRQQKRHRRMKSV